MKKNQPDQRTRPELPKDPFGDFQYRQALDQNFQGNIPPIYTSKFIRSLTLDYMIRTILLDKTARSKGLVFHNDSIIQIQCLHF